jgi:hypothetical protein
MIKKYLLVIILITSCQLFSQEIFLNTGKNLTKYNYKNSVASTSNIGKGTGNFYEIGIAKPFINENFLYSLGVSLNEYNAVRSNSANSYSWNTQYLGLKGGFSYSFFPNGANSSRNLNVLLRAGLSGMSIIYGQQDTDGSYYDLMHEKEFSGIVVGSSVGLQVKHAVSSFGFLSLGYDYGQTYNLSNTTDETISFASHKIHLGIHFLFKSKSELKTEPTPQTKN